MQAKKEVVEDSEDSGSDMADEAEASPIQNQSTRESIIKGKLEFKQRVTSLLSVDIKSAPIYFSLEKIDAARTAIEPEVDGDSANSALY